MSNIYPFLMGQAALRHERIPSFPDIEDEQENHILMAHCGYSGVCPRCFAEEGEWVVRRKVLSIVDDNAHVIEAEMPEGDCTLVKLDPTLSKLMVIQADVKGYVKYPDSDCLKGALIKVPENTR